VRKISIDYSKMAFPKTSKQVLKHKKETVSKSTYQKVFEACKGKCVLCGTKKDLQLHHVNGRGRNLTDNPENCVMLCMKCHLEVVHENQKKYRPILQKIARKLYEKKG
jgi:5-methylcytosine-specific restriction endonuclease McrA